jgi:polyisoprenoid-binding protein YceI
METTTVQPAFTPTTGRTTWTIDPVHAMVEFGVRHLMISTVKGRFTGVTGTIVIDEADLTRSTVTVEIDAATVDTRDDRRDAHLRSADFLEVERYPTITFQSTNVESLGDNRARVFGDLTIHGTTRQVVLETELLGTSLAPWGTRVMGFSATTSIKRSDYGLVWNAALETGGVAVGDTVKITIEVEAVKQD